MPDNGLVNAKVRAYMEALSPTARSMLVRTIQSAESRGDDAIPTSVLIAAIERMAADGSLPPPPPLEARPAGLGGAVPPPRSTVAVPWRDRLELLVLQPLMPIVADIVPAQKQPGRVARASVAAIWTWMRRDVAREAFVDAFTHEPAAGEDAGAIATRLRREVTGTVLRLLRQAELDPKGLQKLASHLGGEPVARDLRDVLYVLQRDTQFAALAAQLPKTITSADVGDATPVVQTTRAAIDQVQLDGNFVGSVLLSRTATPWILAPLAVRLAGSNDPRVVHGSRYARLIDVALSESERLVAIARLRLADRRERDRVGPLLREFHELLRNVQIATEIDAVPAWFKRMGLARRDMSELIGKEIENAAGLVRRALRVESLAGEFGSGFDADACADAEFAVRMLVEARQASENLALNDLQNRIRRQVEQTLEVVTAKLMADLRSNQTLDRRSLGEAVDAAIRMSAQLFGEDYAAVLRKGRDAAMPRGRGGG